MEEAREYDTKMQNYRRELDMGDKATMATMQEDMRRKAMERNFEFAKNNPESNTAVIDLDDGRTVVYDFNTDKIVTDFSNT